jgi:serine phosphatase RsbU (regulator of sigma subunit)
MRSLFRSSRRRGAGGHGGVLFTLAQCVPFAIALLVVGIELSPAHFLYTGPLLTATPALAAVMMGPKGTMWAAGLALAVSVTTATYNEAWGTQEVYTNLLAIAVVSMAGVMASNAIRARRHSELEQIRRIAATAQEVLLRPVPARLGPVRAASLYHAAEREAQIGGDLYEAVNTRYGVRMIVGDVRGKGLPAVRSAAAVLGAFREAAHYEHDLVEVMNHCTAALRRERTDPEMPGVLDPEAALEGFVTALVAQIPDGCDVVEVLNRGHPPPLVLREGKVHGLMPTSPLPPLGLDDFLSGFPQAAESYPFAPGDRLLLHTDGVIEARNPRNEFFPLHEAVEAAHAHTPREFLDELHQRLTRHTHGYLADDVAMVVLDRVQEEADEHPHDE